MKVLIAEDDIMSRKLLEKILIKWNYTVISACDGNDAWTKLNTPDAPQLVVLDWMMPGMDGVELCRKLRKSKNNSSMYIILLTALKGKKNIVEGLDAGANDYVTKPFDYDELQARIKVGRRVVELQRLLIEREKLNSIVEMAGAVCHEFNQPLQVIMGYTDILLFEESVDSEYKATLNEIRQSSEKLKDLTSKLRNITQYKTKKYIGITKIVDIEKSAI